MPPPPYSLQSPEQLSLFTILLGFPVKTFPVSPKPMKRNLGEPLDGVSEKAWDSGFILLLSGADRAQGVAWSMTALCPLLTGLPRTQGGARPGSSLRERQKGGNESVVPEGGGGMLALLPELDQIQQPLCSAFTPAPCSYGSQPLLSRSLSVQLFSRGTRSTG